MWTAAGGLRLSVETLASAARLGPTSIDILCLLFAPKSLTRFLLKIMQKHVSVLQSLAFGFVFLMTNVM